METASKEGEFRESLKETDWAWLAGFLDGEGHLSIRRGIAKNNNKNQRTTSKKEWVWYSTRISVSNIDLPSMKKAALMLNGNMIKQPMKKHNLVPIYTIEIGARLKILKVLKKLIPHLITKKEPAKLMLEFVEVPHKYGSIESLREKDKQ